MFVYVVALHDTGKCVRTAIGALTHCCFVALKV